MNNTEYPLVYILLLNWNSWTETAECLESLKKIKYKNFRILLIDNGSKDDSLHQIHNFKRENPQLRMTILENGKNLGFGGGNNSGIEYAIKNNVNYVLLLNSDTIVAEDFLDELVHEGENNPKTGLLVPNIFFYDERKLLWFGGSTRFKWYRMDKGVYIDLFKKEMPKNAKPSKMQFATGACMLIKREVFEKAGKFYPPYFLYFEDADISFAIRRAGYDLVWVPTSNIWHKVSATTLPRLGPAALHYYNTRNILLLAKRRGPFWVKYFYMHFWAIYKYLKQILKITLGYNKELSLAIKQGVEDYYGGIFGKYEKNRN